MSFGIKVNGGTGAGTKRPLKPKREPWPCVCGQIHAGHWARCPDTRPA